MIEGIKIDVPTADLRAHLEERAEHHRSKSEAYLAQADATEKLMDGVQGQTNDPRAGLRSSARDHAQKAALFAFTAKYLVADETYRLSEQDLMRIEVIARW